MNKFCIIANSFKDNELEISNKIKDRIAKRESVISQAVMERMNKEIDNKLENL